MRSPETFTFAVPAIPIEAPVRRKNPTIIRPIPERNPNTPSTPIKVPNPAQTPREPVPAGR